MADEQIRDLERQSALGDSEAQQRLIASASARTRAGIGQLEVEYLQAVLDIHETMFDNWNAWDAVSNAKNSLMELNEKFTDMGLSKTYLREEVIGKNAVNDDGSWYSSNC